MPTLTRWFTRAAFLYLGVSLALGVLAAAQPFFNLPVAIGRLSPVFIHLFMVGWLTQLIFGVMHWMFPKASKEQPRGSENIVWFVFITLNLGLLLRAVAEPLAAAQDNLIWDRALAISASLQWAAALAFVVNTWPRARGR